MSLGEKSEFGYELKDGEEFVRSDEFAGVLVFYQDQPLKMVFPDGRVEPWGEFTKSDRPAHRA